jgi:hypothetical protein
LPLTDRILPLTCYGARIEVADGSGADILTQLAALLPPEARVGKAAEADVRYELRMGMADDPAGARFWEVTRDGQPRFRATAVVAVVRWLRSDIDHQVATHAREGLFVHAGVVGWRDHAILVPGRSMTGKSTLVAALVRLGARYYSDEYAVLDLRGRVHPYPRRLSIREEGRLWRRRCCAVELGSRSGIKPLPVGLIAITSYKAGARWRPRSLSPDLLETGLV